MKKLSSIKLLSNPLIAVLIPLVICLSACLSATASLVNLPYTNNFDSDIVGAFFEEPDFFAYSTFGFAANNWFVVTPGIGGTGNGFTSVTTNTTGTIYNGATVQTFIPSPLAFSMSAQEQLLATNATGSSFLGMVAFGNRPDVGIVGAGISSGTVIWAEMQVTASGEGSLGWVNFLNASGVNTGITISNQVGANLPINTSDSYSVYLDGSYDANSNLTLVFTVQDDVSGASVSRSELVSASRMATNYSGSYFGFMDRYNSGNSGLLTILHDNFSLSATLATNYLVDPTAAINSSGWTLSYNDEFNGSALDRNKWATTYQYGGAAQRTQPGNNELEVYLDNQFIETNGLLRIFANVTNYLWDGVTYKYASGLIDSYQKHAQVYGYFEMRAKTPPGIPTGAGLWPAFWMLDNAGLWPPETDILEILDSLQTEPHQGAIQNPTNGAYLGQFYPTFDASTAFHVYSLEWNASNLVYYLDGQIVAVTHTQDTNQTGHQVAPMDVNCNLAVGGKGTVPPTTNTIFPAFYDVDYIRIWTRTNGAAPIPYTAGYDIGDVGLAGSTIVNTDLTATIVGAGLGYNNGATADSFQFAAQPMPGDLDYDYLINVSSMSVGGGQVGVMARQSLDPAAPYTAIYLAGGNCLFQSRTSAGAAAVETAGASSISAPEWLRLLRRGTVFSGYISTNGILWDCIGVITNDLEQTDSGTLGTAIYLGAAVSSGDTNSLNTATLASLNNPAIQIIQDNADPTNVTLAGPWGSASIASGGTAGYWGTNYIGDNKVNKGLCSALFTPPIPATASYDLYMRWIESSHAASNVPVIVTNAGGVNYLTLNEQALGGMWVYEGTFPFDAGSSGSILITNSTATAGYGVIVDALRLVPGVSSMTPSIPVPPTGLTAIGSNAAVSLTWVQSVSPGITQNNVYRSTNGSSGPYNLIASLAAATSYTDFNVVNGSTYFYSVTAVNNFGESGLSAYAGTTPIAPLITLADAYVRDGTYANYNFGTNVDLDVKDNATSYNRHAYIKFGVTNLANAKTVTLQLTPTFVDVGASSDVFNFELVTNNSWIETNITWNTRPAGTGTIMGTATGFHTNVPVYVDITTQAKAQATQGGLLTVHVYSTTYTNGVNFASKEAAGSTNWPQLIITQ